MCLLVIIGVVLAFAAVYMMSVTGLSILAAIIAIIVIINANAYSKSLRYVASKKECPVCHSTNIQFNIVSTGAESTTWNYTKNWSSTGTKIKNAKMAVCADCGCSFSYIMESDIISTQSHNKKALIYSSILLGLILLALLYCLRI